MIPSEHIESILKEFNLLAIKKYQRGQKEHGGKLWLKSDMLDKAIEETIDLVIYLLTLKAQLKTSGLVDDLNKKYPQKDNA